MTDQPRPQGQLDVQRWLGRCMLRLQQYERLMKLLLAHHELAGPADRLEAQRAANLEKVSDKTLGTLVKSLFESYAVPDGFERELLPEDISATSFVRSASSSSSSPSLQSSASVFRMRIPPKLCATKAIALAPDRSTSLPRCLASEYRSVPPVHRDG